MGTGLPSQSSSPKATRAPGRGQQRLAAAPARARATAVTAVTAAGARLPALRRLGGARGRAEGTPQTHTGRCQPRQEHPKGACSSPETPPHRRAHPAPGSPGGGAARFSSGVGTPGLLASPCQEFPIVRARRVPSPSNPAGLREAPQPSLGSVPRPPRAEWDSSRKGTLDPLHTTETIPTPVLQFAAVSLTEKG